MQNKNIIYIMLQYQHKRLLPTRHKTNENEKRNNNCLYRRVMLAKW